MRSAKRRFIAKQHGNGSWGVYDTVRGSWPINIAYARTVGQAYPVEGLADTEAIRVEEAVSNKGAV